MHLSHTVYLIWGKTHVFACAGAALVAAYSVNLRAMVWQGAGTSGKSMSRDECELIIGSLFYAGLLSLEMGYTAYATNTYLKLSPQGRRLLQGQLLPLHST